VWTSSAMDDTGAVRKACVRECGHPTGLNGQPVARWWYARFGHQPERTMKFGIRVPSLKKRIAARTSWKRAVRHNLGLKAPRGWGWLTNRRKAAYNRVYNRTSFGCAVLAGGLLVAIAAAATLAVIS